MLLPLISLLLFAASWLAWQAFYVTTLNYQVLTTEQAMSQQFFLAEQALSQAEDWLKNTSLRQLPPATTQCTQLPCIVQAQAAQHFPQQSSAWWQAPNNPVLVRLPHPLSDQYQAAYVIEQLMDASTRTRRFYRITAWALRYEEHNPTVLQTIWKKSVLGRAGRRQAWRSWSGVATRQ